MNEESVPFPERMTLNLVRVEVPRYASNPDQKGAVYVPEEFLPDHTDNWTQVVGPKPSFNNLREVYLAFGILNGFEEHKAAVRTKHGTYSDFGVAQTTSRAMEIATLGDCLSSYGGVVALNQIVDLETAKQIGRLFTEVVCAKGYEPKALEHLESIQKKKIRVFEVKDYSKFLYEVYFADGKFFFEEKPDYTKKQSIEDTLGLQNSLTERGIDFEVDKEFGVLYVTEERPSKESLVKTEFAQNIVWRVHSNGIYIGDGKLENNEIEEFCSYGFGSETSRVDAFIKAVRKAGEKANNATAASDGSTPYRDGIDVLGKAGIKNLIQPGGSIRDQQSIDAANEHKMGMVFSGRRLFKH